MQLKVERVDLNTLGSRADILKRVGVNALHLLVRPLLIERGFNCMSPAEATG